MGIFAGNNSYRMRDTFSNTVGLIFRVMSVVFIILNFLTLKFVLRSNLYLGNVLFFLSSAVHILLLLVVEPYTQRRHPKINFAAHILIALCCGVIYMSHRTYTSMAVFYFNIVQIGLKQGFIRALVISALYYIIFVCSMVAGSQGGIGSILFNFQVLVTFFAAVYMCQFFSKMERRKIKQDETIVELLSEKVKLAQSLENKNAELKQAYWNMVETLIGVIEARDNFTGGHSVKVCEYSVKLAKKLGFSQNFVDDIMKASILHDIGKMGIPEGILLKPSSLSNDEYSTIMSHPEIGCRILANVNGLEKILPMILYHHEKVDGTGYPYGLKGDRIPDGAKIIAIADAYDAMTSNRPYRKALVKKEAKMRLIQGAGTQFDTDYVKKFLEIINEDNVEDIRNYKYIEGIRKNIKTI